MIRHGDHGEFLQETEVLRRVALGDCRPVLTALNRTIDDLVIDVGDIDHEPHLMPACHEPACHGVKHDGPHQVPHVAIVVDRRATDVHADLAGLQGIQGPLGAGDGVVQLNGHGFA